MQSFSGFLTINLACNNICGLFFSVEIPKGLRLATELVPFEFETHAETAEAGRPHYFNGLRALRYPVGAAMNARLRSGRWLDDVPLSLPSLRPSLGKELNTMRGSDKHYILAKP